MTKKNTTFLIYILTTIVAVILMEPLMITS